MGVLLALGTALSYAVMNLSIRKGTQAGGGDNGVLTTLVINVLAFSVLTVIAASTGSLQAAHPEAVLWFAMIGLVGAYFGRTFLFAGIHRIGVVRAGAIKNGAPVITVLLAIAWIGERPSISDGAGIVLILVGVFLVVRESLVGARVPAAAVRAAPGDLFGPADAEAHADRRHATGVALGLLAALSFGAANAISKVGLNIVSDVIQAGVIAAWTAMAAYLVTAALRRDLRGAWAAVTARRPWFWLAGLAATTGQLTFFAALQFAPVGPVTVVAASEVVLTTLLGGLLAQRIELVTRRIAVPAMLVFAGTVLIALGR